MEEAPPTPAPAGDGCIEGCGDMMGCTAMEAAASMAGLSATRCDESRAEAVGCCPPELAPAGAGEQESRGQR